MSGTSSSSLEPTPTLTLFTTRMKPSPVLTAEPFHLPVLLKEAVELLSPPPDGVVLDLTVGMGGHAQELLKLIPHGRLVGLDQDVDALQHAGRALRKDPRVSLFKANFADLLWVLRDLSISEVDSVLMDIGVSSLQLDQADRGFSFSQEGPLDMRMDNTGGHTAAWVRRGRKLSRPRRRAAPPAAGGWGDPPPQERRTFAPSRDPAFPGYPDRS